MPSAPLETSKRFLFSPFHSLSGAAARPTSPQAPIQQEGTEAKTTTPRGPG